MLPTRMSVSHQVKSNLRFMQFAKPTNEEYSVVVSILEITTNYFQNRKCWLSTDFSHTTIGILLYIGIVEQVIATLCR